MKMKIFALTLVMLFMIGPVSAATLSMSFDSPAITNTTIFDDAITGSMSAGSLSISTVVQDVPVPAAAWLFMSGLVGLVGISRRKKTRKSVQN